MEEDYRLASGSRQATSGSYLDASTSTSDLGQRRDHDFQNQDSLELDLGMRYKDIAAIIMRTMRFYLHPRYEEIYSEAWRRLVLAHPALTKSDLAAVKKETRHERRQWLALKATGEDKSLGTIDLTQDSAYEDEILAESTREIFWTPSSDHDCTIDENDEEEENLPDPKPMIEPANKENGFCTNLPKIVNFADVPEVWPTKLLEDLQVNPFYTEISPIDHSAGWWDLPSTGSVKLSFRGTQAFLIFEFPSLRVQVGFTSLEKFNRPRTIDMKLMTPQRRRALEEASQKKSGCKAVAIAKNMKKIPCDLNANSTPRSERVNGRTWTHF